MTLPPIKVISASAGSGKTYSLSMALVDALDKGCDPEGVLATTFTNKAAAELIDRVRGELMKKGKWEAAQRILDGYLGTVNSVCGRLLKKYSFELGLAPAQDVLPEGDDIFVFERAIAPVVERYSPDIDPIALRFGITDWRTIVKEIIGKARQNNLDESQVKEFGKKSWESLGKLLPKPLSSPASDIDEAFLECIEEAYGIIEHNGDTTEKTERTRDRLSKCLRLKDEISLMSWPEWASLSKLDPGKKSIDACEKVKETAEGLLTHLRFQSDLERFIQLIFECSAEAMRDFAEFKNRHGLVDFIDQEHHALRALDVDEVQDSLKQRLELLLVDEFQDTSPIQLALFVKLAQLARSSVWVGDQKQAIYGFRGTDPALMDAVVDKLVTKSNLQILSDSYRSQPGLLTFTNALFEKVFEPFGMPANRVRLNSKVPVNTCPQTALTIWRLARKDNDPDKNSRASVANENKSLASAMGNLLQSPHEYQVLDKTTKQLRDIRGGDIGVLCRTNDRCVNIAKALEAIGVRVTLPRPGLLSTPECVLGFAALRYLADQDDRLAIAEICHYLESPGADPIWFDVLLNRNPVSSLAAGNCLAELDTLRQELVHLTPVEALEKAFSAVSLYETALRWGNGAQRLANIELLRGLALEYQNQSLVNRSAGTPAGLVTFLTQKVRGGELDTQPGGHDEDAIQILTYHKAKGLEWPMVVMSDLHWAKEVRTYGVHVYNETTDVDPLNPLKGRAIRYWPWPFGSHKKVSDMDQRVQQSNEYKEVANNELRESIRLLYVGMTRARDYLIFALGTDSSGQNMTNWLDILRSEQNEPLLSFPQEEGLKKIKIGNDGFAVTVRNFQPVQSTSGLGAEFSYITSTQYVDKVYPPLKLVPSQMRDTVTGTCAHPPIELGNPIPISGFPDMELLGDAVHQFLAIDDESWTPDRRLQKATKILQNWKTTSISSEDLVECGNRFRSYVKQTYGDSVVWHREWPIHLKSGHQKAKGWIDLLLELGDGGGCVIVDHKSFRGTVDQCRDKALEFAPQLALYREAVEKATGQLVIATLIHLPISGVLLHIDARL